MGAPEFDYSVDFSDHGLLLRLSGLKKFGDPRKASGDVLCLCGFPRYLSQDVARCHFLILFDEHMGA